MIRILVTYQGKTTCVEHDNGPFEFGRGVERDGIPRFSVTDSYVSANHAKIEEQSGNLLQLWNLSHRNSICLDNGILIAVNESQPCPMPVTFTLGETTIYVESQLEEENPGALESLASPRSGSLEGMHTASLHELGKMPSAERLARWFEALIAVQKAAVGSMEFFEETARAMVQIIGLDRGLVLMFQQGRWMVQARYPDEESEQREFSMTILKKMMEDNRTYYQKGASGASSESILGILAVIASPLLDQNQKLVGALYGARTGPLEGSRAGELGGITPLEAQFVQLLGSSVSVGLARQEQEAEAGRLRVQFEQFFSADLARELQRNPKLLEGVESEITVLFSDIRGFSRISESLQPTQACNLVSDVMEVLSQCVRKFDGVIADYAGDGIMAMWNAPAKQIDHAGKACQAALAMLQAMPDLSEKWKDLIKVPLRIGVGINTGMALCGNTGSKIKFKYGPLGHTVNLASRIEGATKVLGVPILISGSTRQQLGDRLASRRLRVVTVVGIKGPVTLYQLFSQSLGPDWLKDAQTYEAALEHYETGKFGLCCRTLYPVLAGKEGNYDMPSLSLLSRALECLREPPPTDFNGIEVLESK